MRDWRLSRRDRRQLRALRDHDFQLAFLALLTVAGEKPASRWERPLGEAERAALARLGLTFGEVHRSTRQGGAVVETVFSRDPARVAEYAARFAGSSLDRNAMTERFEGRFFGYPACCVAEFVKNPYAPNGLPREDQAVLFHWACPACAETPRVLAEHRACLALLQSC